MSVSTPNKRSRSSAVVKANDRISNLPQSVICHILSRLTAKEAVRTCVLSRAWEHKWTFIYNINIDDHELHRRWIGTKKFFKRRITRTNFIIFVERVLLVSQNAKSFSLSCIEEYESRHVTSWICTMLRRKVENLDVTYAHEGVSLPPHLLSCTSLRKLELKLCCTLKVPVENSLPRLTVLYLYKVKIQNENPQAKTIKLTFSTLETLELRQCTWLNMKVVDVHAPNLKTFNYLSTSGAKVNQCSIKITLVRVTEFKSYRCVPENITVTGSLTYAVLEHDFDTSDLQLLEKTGSQIRKLLKGLQGSNHLVLSGCLVKAIGYSKREVPLPWIFKLERLVLSSPANTEGLVTLLTATICLKIVEVDVENWDDYDYEHVIPLPHRLMCHLEELKLNNFTGTRPQLNLAKFVLKYGRTLKKVHLSFGSHNYYYYGSQKDEIAEELSRIPKRSPYLMVIIVA